MVNLYSASGQVVATVDVDPNSEVISLGVRIFVKQDDRFVDTGVAQEPMLPIIQGTARWPWSSLFCQT